MLIVPIGECHVVSALNTAPDFLKGIEFEMIN
jgi:hypothetical protein